MNKRGREDLEDDEIAAAAQELGSTLDRSIEHKLRVREEYCNCERDIPMVDINGSIVEQAAHKPAMHRFFLPCRSHMHVASGLTAGVCVCLHLAGA